MTLVILLVVGSHLLPTKTSTMKSPLKSKDFKKNLGGVIKHGLTEDQAIAALTTTPAQILGVSSMMGTVERGKMANLVITDKPYFDEKSNVRFVIVDGDLTEYEAKKEKKKNNLKMSKKRRKIYPKKSKKKNKIKKMMKIKYRIKRQKRRWRNW